MEPEGFDFKIEQFGPIAQNAKVYLNGREILLTGYKVEAKVGELSEITLTGFTENLDMEIHGTREDMIVIDGVTYLRKSNKSEVIEEIKG